MKNIVIIEDEAVAAERLERLIVEVIPDATVDSVLQSIEESVEYFKEGNHPDLTFMDIHLADGLALRIFDQVEIPCPVIFTTAYDQYALDAFKAGAVDYLLKPVTKDDLQRTLGKLRNLQGQNTQPDIAALLRSFRQYRKSFLIQVHDRLVPVEVNKVACFCLEDKIVRAVMYDGHSQIMDWTLDALMDELDPALFFRANRQYIVARDAIKEISVWPISKLALVLTVRTADRIIVSKQRSQSFKQWYTS